jgi:hypothetical protein
MDETPKTKRKKTGGRKRGTPNKRTVGRQMEAELTLHNGKKGKSAINVLHEIMNVAYLEMQKHRKAKKNEQPGEKLTRRTELKYWTDLTLRAAIEKIPYEAPKLNAIAVAPMGVASPEEFAARQRVQVRINIFSDKGELIEQSHQNDVNVRDLPLIEHARTS